MNDFFRRNLIWIAILLCIAGVVLSIIGIPSGNPIFFFIGIILALPTIGYLIYQVFFYRGKEEIDLTPATRQYSSFNFTSIINDKDDVMLNDEITNEDDLEPLYDGYANEQEIAKRLHEVTDAERERAIIELPEIDLAEVQPNHAFDNTIAIQNTTEDELSRQREAAINAPAAFEPEIPTDLIEDNVTILPAETYSVDIDDTDVTDSDSVAINEFEEITEPQPRPEIMDEQIEEPTPILETVPEATTQSAAMEDLPEPEPQYIAPSLDDPTYILPTEPIAPANYTVVSQETAPVDSNKTKVIHVNTELDELRKQKAQEKKVLLSQPNLERYLQRYFIETAACFLMDRTIYKDKNGIAPYNKFAVNKNTNLPEYSMSSTKGRLYKFCTYLVDAERFITHPTLYDDFITAIEQGVTLARISETLHPLYRKKYKKDFILNLSNREDWDNVMILVYNNYILNNDNFKNVFTHVPFEIPVAYNEENIIDYLKDIDLQDRFAEKYPALEEMGVPTFWDALYICFINSIKQKLTIVQIENAVLREYKKIVRALKRADNARRKLLKKAS